MSQINEVVTRAQNGDFESMEYILKIFKPKVTAICREYFLLGADFDDLSQEGMIGLYKAVVAYKPDKNSNFASFATMCIHHQVQNAVKVASSKKNHPLNDSLLFQVEKTDFDFHQLNGHWQYSPLKSELLPDSNIML